MYLNASFFFLLLSKSNLPKIKLLNFFFSKPISKYPPIKRDISFWIQNDHTFKQNKLIDCIQSHSNLVQEIKAIDEFTNASGRKSLTLRIIFCSYENSLNDETVNVILSQMKIELEKQHKIEFR